MNGLNVSDGTLLTPSRVDDLNWKIVGTADFDGNGSRDLVWHHQGDGRIAVWFMNGTTQIGGSLVSPGQVSDLTWKIRGVGDLNGDGRPDLLWQNTADGRLSVWYMNGLNLIDGTLLNPSQGTFLTSFDMTRNSDCARATPGLCSALHPSVWSPQCPVRFWRDCLPQPSPQVSSVPPRPSPRRRPPSQ